MSSIVSRVMDNLLGRGSAAVTVPPLDGALKPNNLLEELPEGVAASAPDNLVLWNGAPAWSEGGTLMGADNGVLADLGSEITALAVSADGRLAAATRDDGVTILDAALQVTGPKWSARIANVTALSFAPDGALWFCSGSDSLPPSEWRRDLMMSNRAGSVGRADTHTGKVSVLARRLGYPCGLTVLPDGAVVFSEAWLSRLVRLSPDRGKRQVILDEIPGYPGRIHGRADGGYWLSVFAPRAPLIEFVLRERAYRKAMLNEVEPEFWVAPDYASGESFNEPLQGGALKQMGILKPWAPTRSYGLVVELNSQFIPVRSFHSRAGGRRHGITSSLEAGGQLWMTSRGAGEIVRAPLDALGGRA